MAGIRHQGVFHDSVLDPFSVAKRANFVSFFFSNLALNFHGRFVGQRPCDFHHDPP